MPDFRQDTFNRLANFSSIKFGADAPLLDTELNELQDILSNKISSIVKAGFKEGILELGSIDYTNSIVTILNTSILFDGDLIFINKLTKNVSSGAVYLEVNIEEASYSSTIKKYGNKQEIETVPNQMVDTRIGKESSRRKVLTYDLVTTVPSKGIKIGEVTGGKFNLTLPVVALEVKPTIGNVKPTNGGIWYEIV